MDYLSKVEQKYKGVRMIERRQLKPKVNHKTSLKVKEFVKEDKLYFTSYINKFSW